MLEATAKLLIDLAKRDKNNGGTRLSLILKPMIYLAHLIVKRFRD